MADLLNPSLRAGLLALLLVLPALADDGPAPAPPTDGPRLQVKSAVVDFGEVVQGQVRELTVPLTNGGTAPLTVTRIEPSCGCTLSRLPAGPIAPGASADLVLRFDSSEKLGAQSIQVLVYSNDPTQQDVGRFCTKLLLQGEVRTLYRLQPVGAFMGEFVRGEAALERTVTITGQSEAHDGFTARVTGEQPDHLKVALEPLPAGPKGKPRGVLVRVTLLPHAPQGELTHVVHVETDIPLQRLVRIPIVGIVTGRVTGPESAQFLRVARGSTPERRIPLERRDGKDGLVVRRVEADPAFLEVVAEPVSETRVDLRVKLVATAPPGPFASVVRVHLDLADQPILEVPVFGHVLPRVQVEPPVVRLPAAAPAPPPPGAAPILRLTLRGGAVKAARIEPAGADLLARIGEAAPGGATTIELVAAPQVAGAARPARLVIETDVPGEERIVLPIELDAPQ